MVLHIELNINAHYMKIIPLHFRQLEEDTLQQCFLFPLSSEVNIRIEYIYLPHNIIQGVDKIMETLYSIEIKLFVLAALK
jgi:hypothetical protein